MPGGPKTPWHGLTDPLAHICGRRKMDRWRLNWFSTRWVATCYGARSGSICQIRLLQGRLIDIMLDALTRPFGERFAR